MVLGSDRAIKGFIIWAAKRQLFAAPPPPQHHNGGPTIQILLVGK